MNDTLKAAGRIGAELGAAKAECERLRELLRDVEFRGLLTGWEPGLIGHITAALSQQDEPTNTYTAVDMATAAAQGFRDGQAAVEQATAQDERKTFEVEIPDISAIYDGRSFIPYRSLEAGERLMTVAQHLRIEKQLRAALTRPAQTEQQPVQYTIGDLTYARVFKAAGLTNLSDIQAVLDAVEAAIAQTAPQPEQSGLVEAAGAVIRAADWWSANEDSPKSALAHFARAANVLRAALSAQGFGKFAMGDLVKKSTGSEWVGRVVGWYSTEQTKEGYAVESSAHRNSVQIYPAKALELVPMAAKEA